MSAALLLEVCRPSHWILYTRFVQMHQALHTYAPPHPPTAWFIYTFVVFLVFVVVALLYLGFRFLREFSFEVVLYIL